MPVKPGLHVRRKHKHKDVYTCDKHKHKVTHASAEALTFGTIARPDCLLARDLIPTWPTRMYADNLSLRNDASIREWKSFHTLLLVLMLASLRCTCKPGRRKHEHKRKHESSLNFCSDLFGWEIM